MSNAKLYWDNFESGWHQFVVIVGTLVALSVRIDCYSDKCFGCYGFFNYPEKGNCAWIYIL